MVGLIEFSLVQLLLKSVGRKLPDQQELNHDKQYS
jgi:hypothetical protein